MKRTTVTLPDDVALRLEREARRRSTSASEIVRQALAAFLGLSPEHRREIPFAALGRSGYTDTSERIEEILAEEWGRARDR